MTQAIIEVNANGQIFGSAVGNSLIYSIPVSYLIYGSILDSELPALYHYDFENSAIVARPEMTVSLSKTTLNANGTDSIAITGAPTGALFTAHNTTTGDTVTGAIDGTDNFTTSIEGVYELKIVLFPYLDWTGSVNAI